MIRTVIWIVLMVLASPAWGAWTFDGTDDSVHWGDIPAIDDAMPLSCSAWVYQDNTTQDHWIYGTNNSGTGRFIWHFDDVGSSSGRTNTYKIFIEEATGASHFIEGATNAGSANTWQHVFFAVEKSATGLQLWIDGTEDANSPDSAALLDNMGSNNANVTAGESADGALDRAGDLAEIACWTRVLADTEIQQLSRRFSPMFFPTSLVFYAPLVRPSNNRYGGAQAGTAVNQAGASAHPRMIYPQSVHIGNSNPAAASVGPRVIGGGVGGGSDATISE